MPRLRYRYAGHGGALRLQQFRVSPAGGRGFIALSFLSFFADKSEMETTGKRVPERRSGVDRRRPRSILDLFGRRYRRRRSRGRRSTDRGAYIDIYSPKTLAVAAAVVLLSAVDAVITAFHLNAGTASELNPILNRVIKEGGLPAFFAVKAVLTAVPVGIIVVHQEWTMGKLAARVCLLCYVLLSCYHICLLLALRETGLFFPIMIP